MLSVSQNMPLVHYLFPQTRNNVSQLNRTKDPRWTEENNLTD